MYAQVLGNLALCHTDADQAVNVRYLVVVSGAGWNWGSGFVFHSNRAPMLDPRIAIRTSPTTNRDRPGGAGCQINSGAALLIQCASATLMTIAPLFRRFHADSGLLYLGQLWPCFLWAGVGLADCSTWGHCLKCALIGLVVSQSHAGEV